VCIAIGCVCVALYGLQSMWGGSTLTIIQMGALTRDVSAGEPWRFITAGFLHGNLMHLGCNMVALAMFGPVMERLFGARRFWLLWVISLLGGTFSSALRGGAHLLSVGASGALFGLMGAGAGLLIRGRGIFAPDFLAAVRRSIFAPIIFNLVYSMTQPNVDLLAHVGGLVLGFLAVVTDAISVRGAAEDLLLTQRGTAKSRPALTVFSIVALLLCVGCIGLQLWTGQPWNVPQLPGMR
jgi:membrane associated rhomboid family serine protease